MKPSKLFLTVILCSGLAFGYGLLGCGNGDEENGADVGCTVNADCDDGLFCNGAETCDDNVCQAGTPEDCDDGVDCTVDSCNEDTDACDYTPDDGECDDGLFCNGAETCDALEGCEGGVDPCPDPLGCDEENDQCTGCVDDAECDDDLFCNGAETCVDNVCQAGTPEDCDDGVNCTVDSCNEDTEACDNTPDNGECDDGLFCNGAETCDAELGCETDVDPCDPLGCDEENDQCTGCVDDADCDDDLFCNGTETCVDNLCQAGTPVDCDDEVGCTIDSCNEDTDACDNPPDDGECDDGLFCNGIETCDAILDCEAGVDPCDDPADCDEDNDQCDEGPALLPVALLSVDSGCDTFIGAHPLLPGAMLCGTGGDELCVLEYDFCDDGTAEKRWNPAPGEAVPGDTVGTGTWSYDGNELTIDTTATILGSPSNTVETYDVAFTYDDGARLDLQSAAQITPGDGSTVVGDYERHASTVATTGGLFAATIDSTADTTMTVTDGAWEATLVEDNVCTGNAFVCSMVPPGGTTVTNGTFTMPGSLYEFDSTYVFQVDDALVLERQ